MNLNIIKMQKESRRNPWLKIPGFLLTFMMIITLAGTAWAEESKDENEKAVSIKKVLVTVTANKIEEKLKDVPQSISVLDSLSIEEKGIKNMVDLIREIPNMSTLSDKSQEIGVNFRGLNSSVFSNTNPVVIYVDGVPNSMKFMFDSSLANVEQIEVLRGPQGTMYGRGTIGGVINIITSKPKNIWTGTLGAEYGTGKSHYMQGILNVNGPLIDDTLYMGLSGSWQQHGGWINNHHSGVEENVNKIKNFRPSGYLHFTPNKRFKARLTIKSDYANDDWVEGYGLTGGPSIDQFNRKDAENANYDVDTFFEVNSLSQSLKLSYEFDHMTFNSVTTHSNLEIDQESDVDYSNSALWEGLRLLSQIDIDTWTQEFRLSSKQNVQIRWVAGVYLDFEKQSQDPYGYEFPAFYNNMFLGNFYINSDSTGKSSTQAIFGQLMIPFSRFELTLGGRYQRVKKDIDLDTYYLPIGMEGPPMYEMDSDKSWTAFLPKVAISYKMNDDWTAYLSYSRGYMPGGFNFFANGGTVENNRFEPQWSTNYELGLKGSLRQLNVSAALFRMDINDIHVYRTEGALYLTDNAEKAHSQGIELELNYRPINSLELTAAVGILDSEYEDYDIGNGIKFDGKRIEQTPAHNISLGVGYYHPKGFYARVDARNRGVTYFFDDVNKDFARHGSYTLLNARIGYRLSRWDLFIFGTNLTDEEYITSFKSNFALTLATFGRPRRVGVGFRYRY